MEQDSTIYTENIEKLLTQYRASLNKHFTAVEQLMKMDAIPIYTRWQELKAIMRSFDELAASSEKSLTFLDRMHNSKQAKNN